MPLSDAEYDHFFKTLNSPRRVSAVCFLRSMYGCQNALVQTLDLYENHGIVPEGRVCSDLAEMPSFPDFCTLTFYRCTLKKYFVKRIQCPDEISETSQNTNQELENIESSSTLQEMPLTNHFPTTVPTMTSPPPLISGSNTPTTATEIILTNPEATTGTVPKLPSIISDITSTRPLLELPTSSTPVTTDSESLLELLTSLDAVIAEQSFPELFTTTLNTAEGSLSQHLMPAVLLPTPVPTLSSTSNAMAATPVNSVSVATESSSEPTTSEATTPSLGSVSTNPATTVALVSSPTSASTGPIVTATETITPSVGSVPTNPATTVAPASSPTSASASPSPVVTVTATSTPSSSPSASSSTPSKTSVLSTKPTIPKSPAHVLPPVRVAGWPVVPISAVLGQYPLQPTSVMQLLLLPPGYGPRKSKPQAIAVSSLFPFGVGPSNVWPKKIMLKPPKNLPTTAKQDKFSPTKSSTATGLENPLPTNPPTSAKWKKFLSQLRDNRVQQLMQKMRELMRKGKTVKKQVLQSTSLQLLSALKNVKQKSLASLAFKKQLQR
ncbi:mucin-2-like [Pseudonaja textilis]|uniref:mucin-2-like n=1 Tax=Pseudonaja textilis TaxID=8673 RepID=UPI000EAA25C2|nr:mucin-2-like [Pseudonaja textilis]